MLLMRATESTFVCSYLWLLAFERVLRQLEKRAATYWEKDTLGKRKVGFWLVC